MNGETELLGFLRYVGRPPGEDHTVEAAARTWNRSADGIREAFDRLDREVASLVGLSWDAADARRFLASWEAVRRDARQAEELLQRAGRELHTLSRTIAEAQHQWDVAMAAAAVAVGVSVGLGVLSFGLADAAAATAARGAVAATSGIAAWLEGMIEGSGIVFLHLAESTALVSSRLAVAFTVNVASQSVTGAITSPDHSLGHVRLGEAAAFAGVDGYVGSAARMVLPRVARAWAVEGAAAMASDAGVQLLGADHDVDPLQTLLSGALGAGGSKVLQRATSLLREAADPATQATRGLINAEGRLRPSGLERARERLSPLELPKGELGDDFLRLVEVKLGVAHDTITAARNVGGGLKGASKDAVWYVTDRRGATVAIAKVFTDDTRFFREFASLDRLRRGFVHVKAPEPLVAERAVRGANMTGGVVAMTVAPGRPLDDRIVALASAAGRDSDIALKATMRAIRSNVRALAELHTRPPGSGGPVPPAYIIQAIRHIDETVAELPRFRRVLGDRIDFGEVRHRVREISADMQANPGGSSLVVGDAHPGNIFHHPLHGTTLIDLPNLFFSMGERGRPIGMPARDMGVYYQRLTSFSAQNGVPPDYIATMQQATLRWYQEAGGAALTPESMTFYRAQTALKDVIWSARAAEKAESFGPAPVETTATSLKETIKCLTKALGLGQSRQRN